jgi:dihydrofolate reductase
MDPNGRFDHVKTQYYTAASLDGFIATPDDSLEWLFPLGDIEATSYPTFVRGDVRPVHEEMVAAAGGKSVWIVGGGELAGQFHDHGLLDELFVQVGSVTLGAGKPLLPRAITTPPLRLISVRAVGTGFAELHYEVPRPQ